MLMCSRCRQIATKSTRRGFLITVFAERNNTRRECKPIFLLWCIFFVFPFFFFFFLSIVKQKRTQTGRRIFRFGPKTKWYTCLFLCGFTSCYVCNSRFKKTVASVWLARNDRFEPRLNHWFVSAFHHWGRNDIEGLYKRWRRREIQIR